MNPTRRAFALFTLLGCLPLVGCGRQPAMSPRPADAPQVAGLKAPLQLGPVTTPSGQTHALPEIKLSDRHIQALAPIASDSLSLDGRLLVISATGQDADLPAIKQTLEILGTPYTVWICADHPGGLTPDKLADGPHGFYQGVILADGGLAMFDGTSWVSGLSAAEWDTLWSYEAAYRVRQITWYVYPNSTYGLGAPGAVDTTSKPLAARLTAAGQTVFSYLNAANPLSITNAYTYLAKPLDALTVPLLSDAAGNALASTRTYPDGREALTLTFDSNQYLNHIIALGYGLVNWVTRGVFLGEQRTYLSPQVDDVLIDDDVWNAANATASYRINQNDLNAIIQWQNRKRQNTLTKGFTLSFAFNGEGYDSFGPTDPLNRAVMNQSGQFFWINHTYDHPDPNLDNRTYDDVKAELTQNIAVASTMKLKNFSLLNFVAPEVSGLKNPEAMRAEYDVGMRYVVSDTSRPGENNPLPNEGIYNASQPSILEIPRYPNNLFYNVSRPAEWVGEYNLLYRSYWGKDLTVAQIKDYESGVLLQYLLKGSWDPWMFHQTNLRNYSNGSSLISDLIDLTLQKYAAIYKFPILSVPMDQLGVRVADRMRYDSAGATALIRPGISITLSASGSAKVPVTGLKASGYETYGNQVTTRVSLSSGQSVTLPLQ